MAERSRVEIQPCYRIPRVILILVALKAGRKEGGVHGILEVVETPEQTRILVERVVEAGHQFIFLKGRGEGAGKCLEWRIYPYRGLKVL